MRKSSNLKKRFSKQEEKKEEAYSADVNDIISKIRETQQFTDKKLEELSNLCLNKECRIKE